MNKKTLLLPALLVSCAIASDSALLSRRKNFADQFNLTIGVVPVSLQQGDSAKRLWLEGLAALRDYRDMLQDPYAVMDSLERAKSGMEDAARKIAESVRLRKERGDTQYLASDLNGLLTMLEIYKTFVAISSDAIEREQVDRSRQAQAMEYVKIELVRLLSGLKKA